MIPIYFPFTWADAFTIQSITAVFPRIAIYASACNTSSMLEEYVLSGAVEIRVPVSEDSQKLEMIVADYHSWARLHQGNDLALLKTRQTPFIDNLSSRIQSEILHYQQDSTGPSTSPVFNARVFLEIAAAYDAQQAEYNRDLENIQHIEKRVFAALGDDAENDEAGSLGNLSLPKDNSGDFMLSERLQAWSQLYFQDNQRLLADDLLVTSRLSVIEWLQDELDMEQILDISYVPIQKTIDDSTRFWQESIMAYLSRLQTHPWPSAIQTFEPPSSKYAWENGVFVKGFIIPEQTPQALLQKIGGSSAMSPDSGQIRHTLIVCVCPV